MCKQSRYIDLTNEPNLSNVRSVVGKHFFSPIPSIARRHKKTQTILLNENKKMFERIQQIKSNLQLNLNPCWSPMSNSMRISHPLEPIDFSPTYTQSLLSIPVPRIIKMRMGKSKNNAKVEILCRWGKFTKKELSDNCYLEISCGQLHAKSQVFVLGEI